MVTATKNKFSIDGQKLGNLIVKFRDRRGLTQFQFTDRYNKKSVTKLSRGTLSNWENGVNIPTSKNLKTLAETMHLSLNELIIESGGIEK